MTEKKALDRRSFLTRASVGGGPYVVEDAYALSA